MYKIIIDSSKYDEELKKSIRYKIAYLSKEIESISEENGNIVIGVNDQNAVILSEKVFNLVKTCEDSYREFEPEVLFENESKREFPQQNVYDQLVKKGWVVTYENGLIGFGQEFLELFEYFDNTFVKWALKDKALQYVYPDLISVKTLNKYNYINQFPNHIMFTSHLQEDIDKISDFSKRISDEDNCLNDHYLDTPEMVNRTAVCTHVYQQYQNKIIDLNNPIIITSIGKCKRYESLNMQKLERLLDFSMREIVLLGSSDYVLEKRDEYIELAKTFIKDLGIKANIKTGNDPFFTSEYSPKVLMQKKFKMKYELNVLLPYNNKELSVGSFNYHGTYFTDAFEIKSSCGKPVNTGCIAFGLERFVYAYLCQTGIEDIAII
jgi:seryl-tRNA synthetase